MNEDFRKFAISSGVNGLVFDDYVKKSNTIISPTIVEERSLNAVTIDIFSALKESYSLGLKSIVMCQISLHLS